MQYKSVTRVGTPAYRGRGWRQAPHDRHGRRVRFEDLLCPSTFNAGSEIQEGRPAPLRLPILVDNPLRSHALIEQSQAYYGANAWCREADTWSMIVEVGF